MINKEQFLEFLKRGGRTNEVAERVIRMVQVFAEFHYGRNQAGLDSATESDLDAFIDYVDRDKEHLPKHDGVIPSAKSYLWALRYYFRFSQNENLAAYTGMQREKRITRKPFLLKDFHGIQPAHIAALACIKIKNIRQMLQAGGTPADRRMLVSKTGIPHAVILELVKLSDLARIPGIKGIRARLYHDAGIDTLKKLAHSQAEEVLQITQNFVRQTGFDGLAPLPAEVSFSIETARSLPDLVTFE
ncbi:MAG TPA: hypothetical protein DCY42_06825 [Chloroflexi bacterium]|nr:hypothetical protein [Chloroflexota bacterium]